VNNYRHVLPITVRTRDIDAWGHVNNAVYFTYLEMARLDYFREVLLHNQTLRRLSSIGIILAEISCQFKQPVFFGQPVLVGTRVVEIGNSSFHLEHRIEADGQLAALGKAVSVHYDYETGMSVPVPDRLRVRVDAFEDRTTDSTNEIDD
jgi:acyl-CoA thioester hydrolase